MDNNNNNNNMTPEEKFSKLLEEMKKLGNIRLSEEFTDAAKSNSKSEDFFDMMSKLGKDKVKEAEQFVKKMKESVTSVKEKEECCKQADYPQNKQAQPVSGETETEKSNSPDKDEMIELIYNEYRRKDQGSKVESLVKELTSKLTEDEQLGICYCIEKAADAEAKAAFIAGFEAAKELLK